MNPILRQFKDENGLVKYGQVFSIPVKQRIPELAKQDFERILKLTIGAVTMALKSINFKRTLNEFQILDLAEAIIDTSKEDYLSFEDLMLFLQKLVRGEYDISYESIDIPKFMKVFEIYREERWQELKKMKEDQREQYKSIGSQGKTSKKDELSEHFASFGSRIHELKEKINDLKEQNNSLKMDNL